MDDYQMPPTVITDSRVGRLEVLLLDVAEALQIIASGADGEWQRHHEGHVLMGNARVKLDGVIEQLRKRPLL